MSTAPSPTQPRAEGAPAAAPDGTRTLLADLRTAPNLVSLARVVFIYVAIGLWYTHHFAAGLGIGFFAGLTDYLDGYLARRLKQSTRIGALLDQVADILFISGCIFVFVQDGTWPAILLFVVLFRESFILCLRASAAEQGFSLPSIFLGKWASNWMFYALALMGVVRGELVPDPFLSIARFLSNWGMVVGVVSSLAAGAIYTRAYARQYRAKG